MQNMPYCERCGSNEIVMLREPTLFGTISAVLCMSCKREFDSFAVENDVWKETTKNQLFDPYLFYEGYV